MQPGQTVNYYDPAVGRAQKAVVEEIIGTGPTEQGIEVLPRVQHTLAKRLNLRCGEDLLEGVPHGTNATEGEAFWLLPVKEKAPAGWGEHEGDTPIIGRDKSDVPTIGDLAAAAPAEPKPRRRDTRR